MNSPKDILEQYSIKPRKSLGQSFLIKQDIIRIISLAANIQKDEIVVEIGSGIGVLTGYLAQKADQVIAIELDDQLIKVLSDQLSKYQNVEIHHGDVLKFNFQINTGSENRKIKIVGNIPYNISSPLLFYLLSFKEIIHSCLLMMQKEFVQRLIALPGSKDYGVPSVILQMFADVEKIMDVPASAFYPRPQVDSSLIKISFLSSPKLDLNDENYFMKLVRDCFAHRRKTLLNNLKRSKLIENATEERLNAWLKLAIINGQRRAETLKVEEFGHLSNLLKDKAV